MDMRGCDMLFMLVEVIVDMCGFVFLHWRSLQV